MSGKYRSIKKRKIVLGGKTRVYSVTELAEVVKVRCYGCSKNSYAEVFFSWQTLWYINQYKPSLIALLYDFAVGHGWDPDAENSTITFRGEAALPEGWENTKDQNSSSVQRV